jgi:hypothetical protein
MDIYEIVGFKTGLEHSGVNFLDPADAFEVVKNGYVYRQELKSRNGFVQFGNRLGDQKTDLPDGTRVMGIFENVDPLNSGTRELLVATKKYLYSYDPVTEIFTQIPSGGSLGAGHSFGIVSNDEYVSGTTYLTKNGVKRFVFTGKGMSKVYFYDGTNVLDFTNGGMGGDNPDYSAPSEGPLTKATKVHWFGERLNLFAPVINAVTYQQGVLYSGIRDSSGNGDKFNVAGAGILSADTYELMKGTIRLGDLIIMKFQGSDWTLEKTRDAFNPYIVKKIPSVIGTDATFSTVAWNYEAKSVGETGLITTDGRQSVRFDNKIPFFTRDEMEQKNIELTYGGFDRQTSQFMFAYREEGSTLDDVTQDKVLIYNYEESTWAIYDQRFSVFGESNRGKDLAWASIKETEKASWEKWGTTEEVWGRIGIGEEVQKTLAGDDEGYVYWLNRDFDDYKGEIGAITQGAEAVILVDGAFKIGDRVFIEGVEGMTEINEGGDNGVYSVTAATGAAITVNFNSTDATAYTGGGLVSKVIDFEAKLVPFNPYRDQGRKCYISHIEFLLNKGAGSVFVDVFEDEETSPFKEAIPLIPSVTSQKQRQWITAIVDQESNFLNIEVKKENALQPIVISSIRIHCKPGAMTDG